MELNLQPLAPSCFVSGRVFQEGDRVISFLIRSKTSTDIMRYDVLESAREGFAPEGFIACSWSHLFKPRRVGENPERELTLTAENLFLTLADPAVEIAAENERLVQFLAMMLERKRVLRPKGRASEAGRDLFEHVKTKQLYRVPAGELSPEFFMSLQEQLSVLVGGPASKADQEPAIVAKVQEGAG